MFFCSDHINTTTTKKSEFFSISSTTNNTHNNNHHNMNPPLPVNNNINNKHHQPSGLGAALKANNINGVNKVVIPGVVNNSGGKVSVIFCALY